MFLHNPINVPKLQQITDTDGKRKYVTPGGKSYPSVTTVLSQHSSQAIHEWRNRVGEKEANRISRQAATRGTHVHNMVEAYLQNKPVKPISPLDKMNFENFQPLLNHINNIRMQETMLYSDYLRMAGTVDCVADWDGKIAVIDFKTSRKTKRKEWIENYFMQTAAYCIMVEERTGLAVPRGVVLISVDEEAPQAYIVKRDNWVKPLLQYRDQWEAKCQHTEP